MWTEEQKMNMNIQSVYKVHTMNQIGSESFGAVFLNFYCSFP